MPYPPPPAAPHPSVPSYPSVPPYPSTPPYPPPGSSESSGVAPPAHGHSGYDPPPAYGPGGYGGPGGFGPGGYGPAGYPTGYPGAGRRTDSWGRPLADWWQRLLAIIVDGFVIGIPAGIILSIVAGASTTSTTNGFTTTTSTSGGAVVFAYLVVAVAELVYFGLLDGGPRGQTIGKRLLGIATRDAHTGGQVGFGRALLRRFVFYALFWLFFIPGVVNVLSPLWDRRRQAWHDKLVATEVIRVR